MSMFDNLYLGIQVAFSLSNLGYCFIGVLLGTAIGVLPGVGPLVTIAVLLPLTFGLPAAGAIIMLSGIYYGAAYGGSTTAILVNLPGESSSAVTCIDGYKMASRGQAGYALAVAALSSLLAGVVGTLLLAVFAPPLTTFALQFGSKEYFCLILSALVIMIGMLNGGVLIGLCAAFAGMLIGIIGMDIGSGAIRFSFGSTELIEGIDFVVIAVGVFAVSEILTNLCDPEPTGKVNTNINRMVPTWQETKDFLPAATRGTIVGSLLGILPGAGQVISSFAAYSLERQIAKDPKRFGNGAVEGVASPEAANNAAAQTSFIPTLTLGIPGSPTMALMLGALMIQGITPGPQVISGHPDLFWGLVVSMIIGNIILVLLNLPLIRIWITFLKIPYNWLYPIVLAFSITGVYTVNNSVTDVFLLAGFGLFGYVMKVLRCEPAPFVLGMLLGPMLETNMRRALTISKGDWSIFVMSPLNLLLLGIAAACLIWTIYRRYSEKSQPSFG